VSIPGASTYLSVPGRIRVLIADDHALIRSGLARLVSAEPDLELVGTAADGLRAVELAEREQPDVVVLDLSMPGLDGVSAAGEMRHRSPGARVLVLSSYVQEAVVTAAFAAGVCGYLLKNVSSLEVLQGIRLTHAGGAPMSERIRRTMEPHLTPTAAALPTPASPPRG
jgi:DNA-binding NarL/FixJ family response regulator